MRDKRRNVKIENYLRSDKIWSVCFVVRRTIPALLHSGLLLMQGFRKINAFCELEGSAW